MFYTKTVSILTKSEGYKDDTGHYIEGDIILSENILCDIQPYSNIRLLREYGLDIKCEKIMFCDMSKALRIGQDVMFENTIYTVVYILTWDDYMEVFLNGTSKDGSTH